MPALITGMAGAISQTLAVGAPASGSGHAPLAGGAAMVATLFGMLAAFTTPAASVLILVLSLLRRWELRVVGILWMVAIASMAVIWPAMDAAVGGWMILDGARSR